MQAVFAALLPLCCSLPAAAALDSQQVLQLFKAAAMHDGVKAANAASDDGDSEDFVEEGDDQGAPTLAMFEPLADRLTEQGVVELLQMAAQNKCVLRARQGHALYATAETNLLDVLIVAGSCRSNNGGQICTADGQLSGDSFSMSQGQPTQITDTRSLSEHVRNHTTSVPAVSRNLPSVFGCMSVSLHPGGGTHWSACWETRS
jgi:hypothetical protein